MKSSVFLRSLLGVVLLSATASSAAPNLPEVDLGYEIHKALSYNKTGGYFTFANIRYAAPPTGQNRFRAPRPPAWNRGKVQDGSQDRICPQAPPAWLQMATPFVKAYLTGDKYNGTQQDLDQLNHTVQYPPRDPSETEDCLFLDVVVPKKIFQQARSYSGAPVLVWIYGGGYTIGRKGGENYPPSGLIGRSSSYGQPGIVYVAINYRLGAFGWLAGPEFARGGTPNAGLYDQRAALNWVKANIAKFGGDPNRVTVMGESAGAGSTTHQLTAFGGRKPVPFQQAIIQSPAWQVITSKHAMDRTFKDFLRYAGASNLDELRTLPESTLIRANVAQIWHATYGSAVYSPTAGDEFVPEIPGKLLAEGRIARNVRIMVGHNSNEALQFTDPFIKGNKAFSDYWRLLLPAATDRVISYLTNELYPPPPQAKGSLNYNDSVGRLSAALADFGFVCNTDYINKGYGGNTYPYYFSVPPGLHGQDVPYTFFTGRPTDASTASFNTTVANALQEYVTTFVQNGRPTSLSVRGLPPFLTSGRNARIQQLNVMSITAGRDNTANARCKWWQQAPYA
ncbi:hypothetical protein FH972_021057 [Carpinus fangiana]|uniref:Carboxylic ester hydrolase n=1 Tax=Carpinus fangiana TaxID=176857 RepID=A0A5N6KN89_9ROSI|nr:hypothetical protein FH972_021057 [Carpinus fangiana]